jgi:predicted O-methyltransferase YrrM
MLTRIDDWFEFLGIEGEDRQRGLAAAAEAERRAEGMTKGQDYRALAALAIYTQPQSIFEIGTFLGVTSDFFLSLLPEAKLVSIAYQNPRWKFLGQIFNNSHLPKKKVGSAVSPANRPRFTQLYGNSHKLKAERLLAEHGRFDLVFVDGDHSREGVAQDTVLAQAILAEGGAICWHDANPKEKYLGVREYLEQDLPLHAVATTDDYLGGVAFWHPTLEARFAALGKG